MKKVIIINTVGMGLQGITSVILNYVQNMDLSGLEINALTYSDTPAVIKNKLDKIGKTHIVPKRKNFLFKYIISLFTIMHCADVVHIHGNSGTMLIEVFVAKICRVKKIVIHAHSTKTSYPFINTILKRPMIWLADECIACSRAAGDWLYDKYPYTILNNAIDLKKFKFNIELREKYRNEFNVEANTFLIGHIGHFSDPKNHSFLIDVFYEYHKMHSNSKLLLMSDGPYFEIIKEKVSNLGLNSAVIFAGRRPDAAEIYSAFDMFILPSKWEGLPLVLLEAQANGLSAIVSDNVTLEAKCTDSIIYKPLKEGAINWAQSIEFIKNKQLNREIDTTKSIIEKGFDIRTEAEKLRQIYLS